MTARLLLRNTTSGLEQAVEEYLRERGPDEIVSIAYAQTQHFLLLSRFSALIVTR